MNGDNLMFDNGYIDRKKYFDYFNNFLSISDIDTLLDKICLEVPKVIKGKECSIFLIPDMVKEYNGCLLKGNGEKIYGDQIEKEFVVLSRTTRKNAKYNIGKSFYCSGQGLTGWIIKNKKLLNIKNMQDESELKFIDTTLEWTNEYKGAENHYPNSSKMPFIGVPLIKGNKMLGVLRVSCNKNGESFSKFSSEVLTSFAGILSNLIENVTSRKHLENSLDGLIKIGLTTEGVFDTIVKEIASIVGANNCELYALDRYGEKIDIIATTGGYMQDLISRGKSTSYERGEGLTGWIFKTGKPLRIKNIHDFVETRILTDADLKELSDEDDYFINNEDRKIKWLDLDKQYKSHPVPHPYFLGVPIKSEASEVIGVLRVSSPRSKTFFDKQDIDLLMDFAKHISLIFKNEQQNKLYNILKEIGKIHNKDDLFEYVVKEIPKLVLGYGCSIFLKKPNKNEIHLAYTSSLVLKKNNKKKETLYKFGEGKTGFVAGMARALIINYYGSGKIQLEIMEKDFKKYSKNSKYLCRKFVNDKKNPVGLIRIIKRKNEKKFTVEEKNEFIEFCNKQIAKEDGGLETYQDICETYDSNKNKHALSFLAFPIKIKSNKEKIFGVIRIPRTSEGVRFSDDELDLIESITGRLVSAIEIEKTTSKIREHLETLSTINNKINSPSDKDEILDEILKILTDNDNLGYEFAAIQLVNKENDTIYTAKCRQNPLITDSVNPERWKQYSTHPLNPNNDIERDIHSFVLMKEKDAIVVKGKDIKYLKYLDEHIFNKFNHKDLVRAFVPIIDYSPRNSVSGMPIGTIEAGHKIIRKEEIDEQELEMLKAVANQVAITIRNWEQKEELRQFKDNAIFRSLSSMASAISHKMNNSVGLIRLKANDLLEDIEDGKYKLKNFTKQIEIIHQKSEEALSLPKQLSILLSKIDSIKKSNVNIDDLIKNKIIPNSEKLKKDLLKDDSITIIYESNPKIIPLIADKALLKETLIELVHNSIKSMLNNGGVISISTKVLNSSIKIFIDDEGEGIPKKYFSEIFSPGFSLRRGSGHGLWMCKNIIEIIHHGKIRLFKSNKKGTRFIVELPINNKD